VAEFELVCRGGLLIHMPADVQEVGDASAANGESAEATARAYQDVYEGLLGHGFQQVDIETAMAALTAPSLDAALDWLCVHTPPARLPHRFAAGAHSHGSEAATRVLAVARAEAPVDAAADARAREADAERRRAWQEEAARARAADDARTRADAAATAEANRARILEQYNASSADESDATGVSEEAGVEDWELWGDPREVRCACLQLAICTLARNHSQLDTFSRAFRCIPSSQAGPEITLTMCRLSGGEQSASARRSSTRCLRSSARSSWRLS
jgi:hypothetical protein